MTHKVFVSSTFRDLKEHRRHVINALESAGFFVDPMEKWTAATDAPQKFSQDRVKGCDLCVLLVAFRRGHVPRGRKRSITQLEYEAARKLGVETLVFMLDERAAWPAEFNDLDKDPELRRWRAELTETKGVGFFDAGPESVPIAPALSRWLREQAARGGDETKSRLAREVNEAVTDFVLAVQLSERGSIRQEDYDAAYFEWERRRRMLASELQERFRGTDLAERWNALADAALALYRLSGTWGEPNRGTVLRELPTHFPEISDGFDDLRVHRRYLKSAAAYDTFFAAWWKLREAALARTTDLAARILAA